MKGKLKKIDKEKLPVYQIIVEDGDDTGISLISLVEDPAIVMKGMAFNNKEVMSFKEVGDKQIIIGPALIPDMKIYREDEKYGQYYVTFTKETIAKMVEKFNKYGSNRKINIDHSNQMVDAFIIEDWVTEDLVYDKSRKYGIEVPIGTYMIMVKIEDTKFWLEEVKGNEKFGFSIEGLLGQQLVSLSKEATIDDLDEEDLLQIFAAISEYEKGVPHYTADGKLYEGPTHKDASGRLMTGAVHTKDSEYLYHKDELVSKVSCEDCDWSWNLKDGGEDPYVCHKCNGKGVLIVSDTMAFSELFIADSSNVDRVKYFEEDKRLVVKFNDGSYYTYFDIDESVFFSIIEGDAVCKTEGENEFGEWFVGKTPSVGAAIWKYLIDKNIRYEQGGSLR
jgi:hypothetical protein